ncbi:MAG: NBR1-Ig-like domain-containing protein [Chloroflexota bacterium]
MRLNRLVWLSMFTIATLVLSACNIGATPEPTMDASVVYTSAAQTLIADFNIKQTQTALAAPPTPLPTNTLAPTFAVPVNPQTVPDAQNGLAPSATPFTINTPIPTSAGPLCNDAVFIADVTVPDGTVMKPGEDFEKTWAVKNSGTCTWDEGYSLVFVAGDKMDGYDLPIKTRNQFVDPGETVNMTVLLTAHLAPGVYEGCWRMRDDKGYYFGTYLCYKIEVKKK